MADQPEMTLCLLKPDAIEGGHMEVYDGQFEQGAAAARDFLTLHLGQ